MQEPSLPVRRHTRLPSVSVLTSISSCDRACRCPKVETHGGGKQVSLLDSYVVQMRLCSMATHIQSRSSPQLFEKKVPASCSRVGHRRSYVWVPIPSSCLSSSRLVASVRHRTVLARLTALPPAIEEGLENALPCGLHPLDI